MVIRAVLGRGKCLQGPRGEGEKDQAPWKVAQSPPPVLPNRSPKAGEAECRKRQRLGRGKGSFPQHYQYPPGV